MSAHASSLAILHTEASCGWGGQEIRILTEMQAMQARGHRVHLLTPSHADIHRAARERGLPVDALPIEFRRPRGFASLARWLRKYGHAFDVIILGDVTSDEVRRADPAAPATINKLVHEKQAGVMMIGGRRNFGNGRWQGRRAGDGWTETELRDVLPVDMSGSGDVSQEVISLVRTQNGKEHYLLKLADSPRENDAVPHWNFLPPVMLLTGSPLPANVGNSVCGTLMFGGLNWVNSRPSAISGMSSVRWQLT